MLDKYKRYAKINIISLFFIAVSFMSVTLAWFAYSGLTDVQTEIGVKAWYIKFDKVGQKMDSNNLVIICSYKPNSIIILYLVVSTFQLYKSFISFIAISS